MKPERKQSRAMRIACIGIAAWFIIVFLMLVTIPFRLPPESRIESKSSSAAP